MRILFILIFCFLFSIVNAQKGVETSDLVRAAVEGRKLIEQGQSYFEEGKFTQAAQQYHNAIGYFLRDFKTTNLSAQANQKQLELSTQKIDLLIALTHKAKALHASKQIDFALQTFSTADRLVDILRKDRAGAGKKQFWRAHTQSLYEGALSAAYEKKDRKKAFHFFEKSKLILLADAVNTIAAKQLISDSLAIVETAILQRLEASRLAAANDKTKHSSYLQARQESEDFQNILAKKHPPYYAAFYDTSVADLEEKGEIYSFVDDTEYIHFFQGRFYVYALRFGAGKFNLVRTACTEKYAQQFSVRPLSLYESLLERLSSKRQFSQKTILLLEDFSILESLKKSPIIDSLLQHNSLQSALSINALKKSQTLDNQSIENLKLLPFADKNDSLVLKHWLDNDKSDANNIRVSERDFSWKMYFFGAFALLFLFLLYLKFK